MWDNLGIIELFLVIEEKFINFWKFVVLVEGGLL